MKPYVTLLACSFFASPLLRGGDGGPPNSWQQLSFDRQFSAWKKPTRNWFITDTAELDPTENRILQQKHSTGDVAVNGSQGKENDLVTLKEFGDCEVHVEFMVAKKSNSGVFVMGSYEVQIYDSFGVEKDQYPGIECGGIYPQWINNQNVNGHSPVVNASKPCGEWQSFDITFRAPRFDASGKKTANARFVKVVHNGKIVQQNVNLHGPTRVGYEPEKAAGPLRLQGDHGPVAYRNVRIRPLDEGDFDTGGFLKTHKDLGYQGSIGLQCYGITGDVREHLERSMTAWRKLSMTH